MRAISNIFALKQYQTIFTNNDASFLFRPEIWILAYDFFSASIRLSFPCKTALQWNGLINPAADGAKISYNSF
jgi:hypothetical protein